MSYGFNRLFDFRYYQVGINKLTIFLHHEINFDKLKNGNNFIKQCKTIYLYC